MTITKNFEYNGVAHTLVCGRKEGKYFVDFDGVQCQTLKKCSLFGVINFETEIIIENKKFTVRWFEKKIYVYDDTEKNIETGCVITNRKRTMNFWFFIVTQPLPLALILYSFLCSDYVIPTFSQPLPALAFILYISIFVLLCFVSIQGMERAYTNPEQLKVNAPSSGNYIYFFSLIVCSVYGIGGVELIKLLTN